MAHNVRVLRAAGQTPALVLTLPIDMRYLECMELYDAQDVFAQIASTDGSGGVKTIIENHDAWTRCESVQAAVTAAVRARLERPLDAGREARISRQRAALAPLVTRLPSSHAAAC